jgi:hypothetical protein
MWSGADVTHLKHVGDGLESSVRVVGEPGGLGDCETNQERGGEGRKQQAARACGFA